MKESTIRTNILKYLKTLPCSHWEVSPPGSPTGKGDITGVWFGVYVAIEVKKPGEDAKRHQNYKLGLVARAWGVTMVADSVDAVREYLPRFMGYAIDRIRDNSDAVTLWKKKKRGSHSEST